MRTCPKCHHMVSENEVCDNCQYNVSTGERWLPVKEETNE